MSSTSGLMSGLRGAAILAAVLTGLVESTPAVSGGDEPQIIAPRNSEVWGVRLPRHDDPDEDFMSVNVSPSGEVVLRYRVGRVMSEAYPERWTIYYYGFFSGRLLHSVELDDSDSTTKAAPAKPKGSATAPGGLDRKSLEGLRRLDRVMGYRLFPQKETSDWPDQDLPGRLEHPRLFPVRLVSPLDHNYVRRDPSGRVVGDKVFVELFEPPATLEPRPLWPIESRGRFHVVRAIALQLAFYRIPDGTLLGVDYERLIAIRFPDRLESPYFDEDRSLMALEGATVRAWIEEGYANLPNRSQEPTQEEVDAVTRYLEDRIVEAWRARR